jgi:TetR/AcrR family transcriptional regulator, transcriptional repressor of bet genes
MRAPSLRRRTTVPTHSSAKTTARPARARYERQLPGQRRLALISATIDCLKRYGHEGLSIRTISAHAGVSVGLINHHFPNKDELIAAAYRHFNAELVGGLQAAVLCAPAKPRLRLRAFLQASFSPPNLDRDVLSAWVVFWGMYRHSRPIQRVHGENYESYVELVYGLLADLIRDERPRSAPVNLRFIAMGLSALLDGLWLEWCLEPANVRPAEAVALCESWIDNLCRGADSSKLE